MSVKCHAGSRVVLTLVASIIACASAIASVPLADVDGDGRDELLLRNLEYGGWVYYDVDDGRALLRRVSGATRNLAYKVAATGDFDGDGSSEALLRHRGTGEWIHYTINGQQAKLTRLAGVTTNLTYRPVAVGDFDGDGGANLLLRDIIDGHWATYSSLPGAPEMRRVPELTTDFAFRLEGIGDFDGDGEDEVLLRHAFNGSWLAADIAGAQTDAWTIENLPEGTDHRPSGIGNFDDDGADEVLLRDQRNGTWHMYDIAGAQATPVPLSGVTTNLDFAPVGIGDVNGDGDHELVLRHGKGGGWIYYTITSARGSLQRLTGATPRRSWHVASTFRDPLVRADRSIGDYLEASVSADTSPGLFAAILDAHGVRAIAVSGVRKQHAAPTLTIADLVHIGANTKAMTSTMLATLVADATFRNGWETSLTDVFPELLGEIHARYHPVTLRQLVTMSSGVAADAQNWLAHDELPVIEQRLAMMKDNLAVPPAGPVGEFLYSDLAYMVAATMAEKVTGQSWEALMRERVFVPLGMFSVGFGSPGELGTVDQPWGHQRDISGNWYPSQRNTPAAMGPAGAVHLTLEDWATFAGMWLTEGPLIGLDRDALNDLISSSVRIRGGERYASGWTVGNRDWGGAVLYHNGRSESWYTAIVVAPSLGRAYIVATNSADDSTASLLGSIGLNLVSHDLPAP